MEQFLDNLGNTHLRVGDMVSGKVVSIDKEQLLLNINYRSDAILPAQELPDGTTLDYELDQTLQVMVVKIGEEVLVSLNRANALVVWDEFDVFFKEETSFDVRVKEVVKGGLVAAYKGVRVFIPASHVSARYTESFDEYVGQILHVKMIDYDKQKRKVVASRKILEQGEVDENRAQAMAKLVVGQRLGGTVVRLENYGAFVDLGGYDGLIHISQMSYQRIKHPSTVLTVGDYVEVDVISIDVEKRKISLKLADIKDNPWQEAAERFHVGDMVTGRVVKLMSFGAFVELSEGVEGLLHISEISSDHVAYVSDVLSIDDEITLQIISMDVEAQKISLSKKALEEGAEAAESVYEEEPNRPATFADLFGDQLKDHFK